MFIDSWAKIFLILYPQFENSTTCFAIPVFATSGTCLIRPIVASAKAAPMSWSICNVRKCGVKVFFHFDQSHFWNLLRPYYDLHHSGCLDPKKFFPLLIRPQGSHFFTNKSVFLLPQKDTNFKNHQNWRKNVKKTLFF